MELATESFACLSCGLISLRDVSTYALQADLPLNTIQKVETISHANLIRIQTKSHDHLALKFKDAALMDDFKEGMKDANIEYSEVVRNNTTELPDLLQPAVQEYILRLLFSNTFSEFVDDLENLINSFERRVANSTIPRTTTANPTRSVVSMGFFEDEKMSL